MSNLVYELHHAGTPWMHSEISKGSFSFHIAGGETVIFKIWLKPVPTSKYGNFIFAEDIFGYNKFVSKTAVALHRQALKAYVGLTTAVRTGQPTALAYIAFREKRCRVEKGSFRGDRKPELLEHMEKVRTKFVEYCNQAARVNAEWTWARARLKKEGAKLSNKNIQTKIENEPPPEDLPAYTKRFE